ncbi:flagellar hook-associated protein FlgK [Syntrophomonas erecta]
MSNFMSLEIGKRSIMAHQTALSVTGHNAANVNTPGYTRQAANIITTRPFHTPVLSNTTKVGQLGTGVDIATIDRMRDTFLDGQIRNENKTYGYWSSVQESLAKMEVILNEPSDDGLRSVMDMFWESWQDLAAHPESEAVRAVVAERGMTMADTFNHTYRQLVELREDVNTGVKVKVDEINSIARQIADLNQQILSISIAGKQPNDLMDKRDLLLDQLSQIVDVNIRFDQNGMVTVQLGGRELVQGVECNHLTTINDTYGMHLVVWEDTGVKAQIKGGELRGLLDVRGQTELESSPSEYREIIPQMIDDLDKLAKTVVLRTNEIHRGGYTLNNHTAFPDGLNFFQEPTDINRITHWAAYMAVDEAIVNDIKNIAAADHRTCDDNGVKINYGDGSRALRIAGLKHDYNSAGYQVQTDLSGLTFPYNGEINFTVKMLQTDGTTKSINIGIGAPADQEPPGPLYQDLNGVVGAIQKQLDNEKLPLQVRSEGPKIIISSASLLFAGVEDLFGANLAPVNRNGVMITGATADDFWRALCAEVGVDSQQAVRMVDNQEVLLNQLETKRQSVSGVSLDEEMINMIRFQHAYNAASRFITTIDEAMDVIVNRMGLVGR